MVQIADVCTRKPDVVLFDDMDHYKYFIVKNFIDPLDTFLVSLQQHAHQDSLVMSRIHETNIDNLEDCYNVGVDIPRTRQQSTITIQTLISKNSNAGSK